jgi:hypothetical protein
MAQDPLSRVASWLTPASADVTDTVESGNYIIPKESPQGAEDPVLALIAEEKRLEALWIAAYDKGDKRQEEALDEPISAILEQIYNTPPVTIAGAIAMLELGLGGGGVNERLTNAAIASLRDMQPEASPISTGGDDRIFLLFREWMVQARHADALSEVTEDDDPDFLEAVDRFDQVDISIAEVPATALVGFAIKTYLCLHKIEGGASEDGCVIFGDYASSILVSVLRDAARFAPVLEPLVTAFLGPIPISRRARLRGRPDG